MLALGTLALTTCLCVIGAAVFWRRPDRVARTPLVRTGDLVRRAWAPDARLTAVSVQGRVRAERTLVAPITGAPCLYHETRVVARWTEGGVRREVVVLQERAAAPFSIDDGTGAVAIDAARGGDFDLRASFLRTLRARPGETIELGPNGLAIAPGTCVDGVEIPGTARFEVVERVLEEPPLLYANGALDGRSRIGPPGWTALVLRTRDRDALMRRAPVRLLLAAGLLVGSAAVVASALALAR